MTTTTHSLPPTARELTDDELEQVAGGMDRLVESGAMIIGLGLAGTATTVAFAAPIGISLIGMGLWKMVNRH